MVGKGETVSRTAYSDSYRMVSRGVTQYDEQRHFLQRVFASLISLTSVSSIFTRSSTIHSAFSIHQGIMENALAIEPVKLVFLGDRMVGKSSLLLRFSNGDLTEDENLVVFDFSDSITVDEKSYHVNFWDIDGGLEERFRSLAYHDTDIFLLCFDITNRGSFINVKESWIKEIHSYSPFTPFLLIGNKMDLRNER